MEPLEFITSIWGFILGMAIGFIMGFSVAKAKIIEKIEDKVIKWMS